MSVPCLRRLVEAGYECAMPVEAGYECAMPAEACGGWL